MCDGEPERRVLWDCRDPTNDFAEVAFTHVAAVDEPVPQVVEHTDLGQDLRLSWPEPRRANLPVFAA